MVWRELIYTLLGDQYPLQNHSTDPDTSSSDELDSKTRNFAKTCVDVIKEAPASDFSESKEVWSTVRIALEKMYQCVALENPHFRKALFQVEAVQALVECCDNQRFLDHLSPENKAYMLEKSWGIVLKIAFQEELCNKLQLRKSFLEMVIRQVKVEAIETGLVFWALLFISGLIQARKDRQSLADHLGELGLAARCAAICRVASEGQSPKTDRMKESVETVYTVVQNATYWSHGFALAAIDAGFLELLVDICRTPLDTLDKDEADLFRSALCILANMSRFKDLHQHFVENRAANDLMPLMGIKNEGLRMVAMFVLSQVSNTEEEINTFLQHFNNNGTLLTTASWTEKAVSSKDHMFHDEGCGSVFLLKDFLEFICRIAQLPGQQLKILESKWPELFCRLLDEGKEGEKVHVINCLLTLSEFPDVRPRLAENEAVVRSVRAVQESGPSSLSQPASLLLSRLLPLASPSPEDEIKNEP